MKLKEKLKTSDGSLNKKNILSLAAFLMITLSLGGGLAASQITLHNGSDIDLQGGNIKAPSNILDSDGDTVASVNDNQNSLEVKGGFQLPTGADAYN